MSIPKIRVIGKGVVKASPDKAIIRFELSHCSQEYGEAVAEVNQKTKDLKDAVESIDGENLEVKTVNYSVEEKYEWDDSAQARKFVGFSCTHKMNTTLTNNTTKVGQVVSTAMNSGAQPKIKLEYGTSDPELMKQKILEDATKNARIRANKIASTAGLTLGKILSIDYSYSEVQLTAEYGSLEPENRLFRAIHDSPEVDPDDIEAEDTVVVTWELLQ